MNKDIDLLIVGGGPAGLAAAVAAREEGIEDILIVEREERLGGILKQCIHNGFGLHRFNVEMTGPEYAQKYIDMVDELKIPYICNCTVLNITHDRKALCVSREQGLVTYNAKAIILAMGCRERPAGALAISGTRCSGVFSAGTAQRFVNLEGLMPGKEIVILGSGDIGLIMARRMTLQGAHVKAVVELMPFSSGLNRNIVQCLEDYNIPLYLEHTVTRLHGKDRLTGVSICKVDKNRNPIPESEMYFDCDTLLLSVGLIPENELSESAGVKLSPLTRGAVVGDDLMTSVDGIYSCGNVLHVHDLVDFVSDESAKAGKAAAKFIREGKTPHKRIKVNDGFGVRGAVPQFINIPDKDEKAEPIQIMFRVDKVYENARISIKSGENEIYGVKKRILTPGEMADIKLKAEIISSIEDKPLTIEIEE